MVALCVCVGGDCLWGGVVQSLGVTKAAEAREMERSGGQSGVTHLLFSRASNRTAEPGQPGP